MALTHHEQSMLQIVLKKLVGRSTSQTPVNHQPGNEALPTNVQVSSTTVFADPVPDMPWRKIADNIVPQGFGNDTITCVFCDGSNNEIGANYNITDTSGNLCDGTQTEVDAGTATYAYESGIVESVKLNLVPIEASKYNTGVNGDIIGIHGYYATLPSDYDTYSKNSMAGNSVWSNGKELFKTLGKIQAVPPIYGFDSSDGTANGSYPSNIGSDSVIYDAILRDVNGDIITKADARRWYYDYYSGVYFQEIISTNGTTTDLPAPATIEVLLFIGRYVSDVLDTVLDFTPTGSGTTTGSGLIGEPRDDLDYDTNGQIQGWYPDTPTGHALDDVNEELKILHDDLVTLTTEFDNLEVFVHQKHPADQIQSAIPCPDVNRELFGSDAPVYRNLQLTDSFRKAKLSANAPWGANSNSESLTTYTGGTKELSPIGGLNKSFKDSEFNYATGYWASGNDHRLGIYHNKPIAGAYNPMFGASPYGEFKFYINNNVVSQNTPLTIGDGTYNYQLSYPAKSFGRGDEGTLDLYLNDQSTPFLTIDLTTANPNGDSATSSNNSKLNIGALKYGKKSDGTDDTETPQYREGPNNYVIIKILDMRVGWNFIQVAHSIPKPIGQTGFDVEYSTYVTWIVDANTTEPQVSSLIGPTLVGTPTYSHLSGVEFASNIAFDYGMNVNNVYTNFYYTTNLNAYDACNSCPPGLEWDDYTWMDGIKTIHKAEDAPWHNSVTSTDYTIEATQVNYPTYWVVQSSISDSIKIKHPYDYSYHAAGWPGSGTWNNLDVTHTKTWNHPATLRAPYPSGGSDVYEGFDSETYRLLSADYNTQSSVPSTANWDSGVSLNGIDGLLVWNSALRSPRYNGGGITNGNFNITTYPPSNENYSGLTTGVRYYYRAFKNTSGSVLINFNIDIVGSGTIVNFDYDLANNGADTDNIQFGIKVPENAADGSITFAGTEWLDATIARDNTANTYNDGDGILYGGSDNNNATFSTTLQCTLGAYRSLKANDYLVIRIAAHSTWTGYISSVSFTAA